MGRVSRKLIGRLNPDDWEFIHGFEEHYQPIWRPRHDDAQYIFRSPGRTSMTGIHYFAPLDIYVMPQWYYSQMDDPKRRWKATQFEFYSAPAPWGPWTLFHVQDFEPQSWYNPCIPSKFISEDGLKFWIFAAGNYTEGGEPGPDQPTSLYSSKVMPVTLAVENE